MTAPYVSEYVLAALQRARLPIRVEFDEAIWNGQGSFIITDTFYSAETLRYEDTPAEATAAYIALTRELMP